jgi:hypothetical protein
MPLSAHIMRQELLAPGDREGMLALHARHFGNVRRERFLADLAGKDWVILLRRPDSAIAGFSTQMLLTLPLQGREHRFLFSGDTVVDRAHWRSPALAGSFGHLMLRLIGDYGEDALHWFLISKGFRTYRFLPVFFRRFFPTGAAETPAASAEILHAVAIHRFGAAYHPGTGLVRLGPVADWLLPELARVPPERRRDPHVAFFLQRNPDFAAGDELACLADIRRDNFTPSAWRVIHSTRPAWWP